MPCCYRIKLLLLVIIVCSLEPWHTVSLEVCSSSSSAEGEPGAEYRKGPGKNSLVSKRIASSHDAVCPAHNTCCSIDNEGRYGCIPSDLGKYNATCCHDHDPLTGCGVGYECRSNFDTTNRDEPTTNVFFCQATSQIQDPLVQILPRYRLCTATEKLQQQYGLVLPTRNEDSSAVDPTGKGRLAYYSSHGDISTSARNTTNDQSSKFQNIKIAVIVIHGATRNADDYWCSMVTAAQQYSSSCQSIDASSILVVAPHFANVGDPDLQLVGGGPALQWKQDHDGAWRYGADAVYPFAEHHLPSSFDGVDALVSQFQNSTTFPSLTRIVVAGHSSGGQFVQRWALLTPRWDHERMRAVVANPSSYAYLTPHRYIEGEWKIPPSGVCPQYNQWEWGLQIPDGKDSVRYLNQSLQHLDGNLTALIERFLHRRTIYMIGAQDRCNTTGRTDWCYSHGLETTCADELQGSTRYERVFHYFQSLLRYNKAFSHRHEFRKVPEVGHDHSLMFNSPEGMKTLFMDQ